jgi:hypothetical protein
MLAKVCLWFMTVLWQKECQERIRKSEIGVNQLRSTMSHQNHHNQGINGDALIEYIRNNPDFALSGSNLCIG